MCSLKAKQTIMGVAVKLMKKRPIDQITTSDIIEHSGLSRSTFYRCFRDKYDIIFCYLSDMAHEIIEKEETNDLAQLHYMFCRFALENKTLLNTLIRHDPENTTMNFVRATTEKILHKHYGIHKKIKEDYYRTILISAGTTACIYQWITKGSEIPPEEFSNLLASITQRLEQS